MGPKSVTTRRDVLEESIGDILNSESFRTVLTDIINQAIQVQIKPFIEKISNLELENSKLQNRINELEQQKKLKSLRIFGLEKNMKPAEKVVNEIFKSKLDLDIQEKEIKSCYFTKANDKCIIVNFFSKKTRDIVFQNKKNLKGSKISILEDLTRTNVNILKKMREKHGFKNVWTINGKIKCKENGKIVTVNSCNAT